MAELKKKKVAALAAVNPYLQEEEAAALLAQAVPEIPVTPPPLWALAGRQDIMTMRRLIQMKAF